MKATQLLSTPPQFLSCWAYQACSYYTLLVLVVLPVYPGHCSFARGDCWGITVFTHTGPFDSISDIFFDMKPCSVPAQGCFLTTPTLRWGTWMTLHFVSTVNSCTDSLLGLLHFLSCSREYLNLKYKVISLFFPYRNPDNCLVMADVNA